MNSIFNVLFVILLVVCGMPALGDQPAVFENTEQQNVSYVDQGLTFGQMWSKYYAVQFDKDAVGYSPDFLQYCTKTARGCGFDSTKPGFDQEFHGNFNGYTVRKDFDGVYRYYAIP